MDSSEYKMWALSGAKIKCISKSLLIGLCLVALIKSTVWALWLLKSPKFSKSLLVNKLLKVLHGKQ